VCTGVTLFSLSEYTQA